MRTGFVVDMRHYLTEDGALEELPNQALSLVVHFGAIVAWMTSGRDAMAQPTNVPCRRSPGRQRCLGEIHAAWRPDDPGCIEWFCPFCDDHGFIRGWEGTLWDRRAVAGPRAAEVEPTPDPDVVRGAAGGASRDPRFTPEAWRRWAALEGRVQTLLLNNVWCSRCGKTTTIVDYSGVLMQGNLVLEGQCMRCGGRVARLCEGD